MKCKICGNQSDTEIYQVREMMYGLRDVHNYFQCKSCHCLQIVAFPEDMQKYYINDYYSFQVIAPKTGLKSIATRLRDKYALLEKGIIGKMLYSWYPSSQFKFLKPLLDSIDTNWSVLDVGCGSGDLLVGLQGIGFNKSMGVDPFIANDIDYGNGLIIKKTTIHHLNEQFDLIMFHHSFEHLPDPIETLKKVSFLLKPGGHCIIRIPTVSSYAWKEYGVNWVQLDAPRHFFLHSTESIKLLSSAAGLELTNIVYDSTSFQFLGSEQYRNDIPLKDPRSYMINMEDSIFTKKEVSEYEKMADQLNRNSSGDQAIFYLCKV